MVLIVNSRQEMENLIVTMHLEGSSIRGLAKHFKISRNTVRKILKDHDAKREKGHNILLDQKFRIKRRSKLDPFEPRIKELLKEFPDIKGQRVFEEIQKKGYSGSISILRERLRLVRPKPKKEPIVRFETDPGIQAQMDWSPYTINFSRTGKSKILCYSYILGYSRRHYIDFTTDRKFHTLIRCFRGAFEYFGGVPKQCLHDNEKTMVLRWEAGHPVYNPAFISFITHYNCRPIACRPRRPETKGKVEEAFQYIESSLLNGRRFQDLQDLKSTSQWWLKNKSDIHIHSTTGRPPIELFIESELPNLQPLPLHPYDTAEVKLILCYFDGFLKFKSNQYSVPYEYIGEIMSLKATEKEIFIYSPELKLVGHHERFEDEVNQKSENPLHRNSSKVRYGLEPLKSKFLNLGDAAQSFMAGLKEKYPRHCGFHARYILQLKEHYLADDINKALKHAIRYYAFDGKAIERILKAKATPRTLESIRNERARKTLQKVLPEIRQRPLGEYNELFDKD
ncbi:MAG: IS21 family transposase [Desulfobacterales bacterium]|nr:IS21 family transposase [Desulfobacterales bacterium]